MFGDVENYCLRVGRDAPVGLPPASMLPVNSATRALILATRDSIAGHVSTRHDGEIGRHTLFSTLLSIIAVSLLTVSSSALLLTLSLGSSLCSVLANLCPSVLNRGNLLRQISTFILGPYSCDIGWDCCVIFTLSWRVLGNKSRNVLKRSLVEAGECLACLMSIICVYAG